MVPNAPSQTAEAVCLMRAIEQRRPADERIIDDSYAKLFLSRLTRAALVSWEASGKLGNFAERLSPGVAAYVLTRHRFIDDCLRQALAGAVEQLSLLGEPVTFGIHPEDVGPFLDRLGYGVVDLADAEELERRYIRDGRRVVPGNYVLHAVSTAPAAAPGKPKARSRRRS